MRPTLRLWLSASAVLILLISAAPSESVESRHPRQRARAESRQLSDSLNKPTGAPQHTSITGRVVTDAGRPLRRARVALRRIGPVKGVITVASDEEGRFSADGLRPGPYVVDVSVPGYVLPAQGTDPDRPAVYYPGDSVTLTLVRGGVITGRVVDAHGKPLAAVSVRPIRVRELDGKPVRLYGPARGTQTDDRGVYRLYGLAGGVYIVATGGSAQFRSGPNAYERDAPTYYPSATRGGAVEIRVEPGTEATGIDVRYRSDSGSAISGAVAGLPPGSTVWLTLSPAGSNVALATVAAAPGGDKYDFAIYGIPDGEYDLLAFGSSAASGRTAFTNRRIVVRGGDVSGLSLSLVPLGSIAGKVRFEPDETLDKSCAVRDVDVTYNVFLKATRSERSDDIPPNPILQGEGRNLAGEGGEFVLSNLVSGRYRIESQLLDENLYVRSITSVPSAQMGGPVTDVGRDGLMVARGEQVKGVIVTVTNGAAALRGKVRNEDQEPAPAKLYLVSAEQKSKGEVFRYYEAPVDDDGSFSLSNLAPGRYWVVTRAAIDGMGSARVNPPAWDPQTRAELYRDAEAAAVSVELRPCQQLKGYVLTLPAASRLHSK